MRILRSLSILLKLAFYGYLFYLAYDTYTDGKEVLAMTVFLFIQGVIIYDKLEKIEKNVKMLESRPHKSSQ